MIKLSIMKRNLLTCLSLIATIAIIGGSWSCTKENVSTPADSPASLSPAQDASQVDQAVTANVVPGIYTIIKFIDTGDDQTSDYNSYTFKFKSDGTLVANKRGTLFTGKWSLNQLQT